jgi:hypothetical protein
MADRRFFSKLAKHHKLPKIDFPWPVEEDEDASRDTKKFFGKTNFVNMLSVLSIYMREFPELKGRIKCIVIATDAGGDRAKSFKAVKNQIVKASNFPVPDRVMKIKGGEHGFPSVVSGIPSFRERPDCEALWPS